MRGVKGPPEPEDLSKRPSASRAARPAPSPAPFRHLRRSSQRPVLSLIRKGARDAKCGRDCEGKGGGKRVRWAPPEVFRLVDPSAAPQPPPAQKKNTPIKHPLK